MSDFPFKPGDLIQFLELGFDDQKDPYWSWWVGNVKHWVSAGTLAHVLSVQLVFEEEFCDIVAFIPGIGIVKDGRSVGAWKRSWTLVSRPEEK